MIRVTRSAGMINRRTRFRSSLPSDFALTAVKAFAIRPTYSVCERLHLEACAVSKLATEARTDAAFAWMMEFSGIGSRDTNFVVPRRLGAAGAQSRPASMGGSETLEAPAPRSAHETFHFRVLRVKGTQSLWISISRHYWSSWSWC